MAVFHCALARGFSVLGSLDTTPEWAATPGIDQSYTWWRNRVPRDWAQWSDYVQAAIRAFPGIRHLTPEIRHVALLCFGDLPSLSKGPSLIGDVGTLPGSEEPVVRIEKVDAY